MAHALHPDSTLDLLRKGYLFGYNRFEALGTDSFDTRLLGRPITILRGVEAARFFYEGDRFTRTGALPISVVHSLQDEGSVQTMDGGAHRVRKSRFTEILDEAGTAALVEAFTAHWAHAVHRWQGSTIAFLPRVEQVLLDAVLDWLELRAGTEARVRIRREVAAMIDGAGAFGPRNWWGRLRRLSTERWARHTARNLWAHPRGRAHLLVEGLDEEVAGVELLNVVRPVVAVGRFIAFAVLALDDAPAWREHIAAHPEESLPFAQEVRRLSPFFPVIAGRARQTAEFDDRRFAAGAWVMLDIFATNHYSRHWHKPWVFDPNRYDHERAEWIVAQGAGHIESTHRCPGEPATVALLRRAVQVLASGHWSLPEQAMATSLRRFPANPAGRLLVDF